MAEKITLELPEAVVQRAQAAAARTGRAVEQVLADWVARGAERDVEALLIPGVEYPIYTPFGGEEAAQVLNEALKAHRSRKGEQK